MFDDLVGKARRKTNRTSTVALAAALHAGAIALAILWTRPVPPEPIEVTPQGPIKWTPPPRGTPDKPPGAVAEVHPVLPQGQRPPIKRIPRTPRISHEPVEPTIQIEETPEVPEPIDAPSEPTTAVSNSGSGGSGAPGDAGPGGGGVPDGERNGTGVSSTTGGPRRYEDVVTLAPGVERPMPSASCRPPAPRMPDAARLAGITGRVLVQFTVHGDGQVDAIRSLDPSTPRILVEAVAEWLQGCPFQPGLVSGRPVAVKMSQSFNFRMQ